MNSKISKKLYRTKFTLIELLVVIAIIAILAGMLLPALSQARERAKAINCMGNMKQLANGVIQYTDTYSGFLPILNLWSQGMTSWKLQLLPLIKGTNAATVWGADLRQQAGSSVFRCPSWTIEGLSALSAENKANLQNYTKSLSSSAGGYGYNWGKGAGDGPFYKCPGYYTKTMIYTNKLASLKNVAELLIVGETMDQYATDANTLSLCYSNKNENQINGRHQGYKSMNIAWGDGHAGSKTNRELAQGKPRVRTDCDRQKEAYNYYYDCYK